MTRHETAFAALGQPLAAAPQSQRAIDPAEQARLLAEVNDLRKKYADMVRAIQNTQSSGLTVPSHRYATRDRLKRALDAAIAAYVAYAGEHPPGGTGTEAKPTPAPSVGVMIADRAALDAALASAKGGELFRLAAGHYGSIEIKPNFAVPVTLQSDGSATFGSIKLLRWHWQHRGKGFVLDGLKAGYIGVNTVDAVRIRRCDAEQVVIESANDVVVERCWLHDGQFPLRILRAYRFKVTGNILERAREDTMRISGDSRFGEVRGNAFFDNRAAKPMHGDHLQIFGLPNESSCPQDMTIEQNLFHDWAADGKEVFHTRDGDPKKKETFKAGGRGTPAPAQGIFVGDGIGDFERFSIRHNLMRLSMVNAIYIKSGKADYLVSENIVLPIQGQTMARIRLPQFPRQPNWNLKGVKVTRCVAFMIEKETPEGEVLPDNFTFGSSVDGLFAGISDADGNGGREPEHYRLAPKSRVPAGLVDSWLEATITVLRATLNEVRRGS
ncbi:right-handed parallel beta-helix repeat-containing protein [Falsirhodobacter xinxiangensis]|uniref:right-handed parallel beta-helix repeat-containing protein n=1 Tax=Falsirhodobacter xinxiangensis TaxID=2530049 RepID=UPI0010AA2938|nr:right-handed parallel beta-helix repeat-containing protein [Rhodobacter xinxiangensis]